MQSNPPIDIRSALVALADVINTQLVEATGEPSAPEDALSWWSTADEVYEALDRKVPKSTIRWHIHHANENGLAAAGAITKRGKRRLIHELRFSRWLAGLDEEATA